jgi:hypothetical protein
MFIAISSLRPLLSVFALAFYQSTHCAIIPAINRPGGAAGSLTKSISSLVAIVDKLPYRNVSFPAY